MSDKTENKRGKNFDDIISLKEEILELVKELLIETTEKAFGELGYKRIEKYQGEYGNGEKYGHGSEEGKYDIKLIGKTKSFLEKEIILGAKKTHSFIDMDLGSNKILKLQYTTTENSIGRINSGESLMIRSTISVDASDIKEAKKKIKDFFSNISKQEVYYITETKLGIEDKLETHLDTLSENNNMEFSLKKLFFGSPEETEQMMNNFINEAKKKEKNIEQNSPEVKAANTKKTEKGGTLLFDDEEEKDEVSEMTTAGNISAPGTAGPFQYNTPYMFKKQLKAKKESMKRPVIKKEINEDGFWTKVDLEPLQKTHVMGMPGVKPGSKEELKRSMNGNKPSIKINESIDLTKRKFIDDEEREGLGVNKRYIVTKKLTTEEEKNKFFKLSGFKLYESIKEAEEVIDEEFLKECGCNDSVMDNSIAGDEYENLANKEFEKFNDEEESENENSINSDEDSDDIVIVSKPDSFINYKFAKDDFLNENKYFIKDYYTGSFVVNPNHKKK